MSQKHTNKIWWLASYPKSGSTWVRKFLDCAVTKFPLDLNSAFQYVYSDQDERAYQPACPIPFGEWGYREEVYCRTASLVNRLALCRGLDCCLKTHFANVCIDYIPMIPPQLSHGALYIVRDPRDVAVSFARHTGKSVNKIIDLMNSPTGQLVPDKSIRLHIMLTSWSKHFTSWMEDQNPITTNFVRYESLLKNPHDGFTQVLRALGLRNYVSKEAFEFALRQTTFSNMKKQEGSRGFREAGRGRFFGQGRAGGWRNALTRSQVTRIEECHGDVMKKLGYEFQTEIKDD